MYKGKRTKNRKFYITLMAALAVFCVTVAGTLAFIVDESGDVVNTFTLSKVTTNVVEDIENGVKQNVQIANTGDTEAYIRAAVVVTWQDANGNVYGQQPKADEDYDIQFNTSMQSEFDNGQWTLADDGFWYWSKSIAPNDNNNSTNDDLTGILITSCSPVSGSAPDGYNLAVEIIGSGIQSRPDNAVVDAWKNDKNDLSVNTDGTLSVTAATTNP